MIGLKSSIIGASVRYSMEIGRTTAYLESGQVKQQADV